MDHLKFVCALLAPLVLASLGCGSDSGPESIMVSGKVTFDGSPLPAGDIFFRDPTGEVRGCGGKITDGQYSFESSPGSKNVEIIAMREVPGKMDNSNPGDPVPLEEMYIPEIYNAETTLTADVEESGTNEFNFDLSP